MYIIRSIAAREKLQGNENDHVKRAVEKGVYDKQILDIDELPEGVKGCQIEARRPSVGLEKLLVNRCQTYSCGVSAGTEASFRSWRCLHICFITKMAAAPITIPEIRFSFAVKNMLISIR